MRNDKRFWQRFSTIYARFMSNASPTYAEACRRIKPRIAGMEVLEIACGTGQFTAPLASGAKSYLATDYSERMLAKAKRHAKAPGLSFSVQDATNLDFTSGRFDAVVIGNALHIMPDPDAALKEIRRVLKPDGVLFAPTFVRGTVVINKLRMKFIRMIGLKVYHNWSDTEFLDYLPSQGFKVEEHETIGTPVQPMCFTIARPE